MWWAFDHERRTLSSGLVIPSIFSAGDSRPSLTWHQVRKWGHSHDDFVLFDSIQFIIVIFLFRKDACAMRISAVTKGSFPQATFNGWLRDAASFTARCHTLILRATRTEDFNFGSICNPKIKCASQSIKKWRARISPLVRKRQRDINEWVSCSIYAFVL